MQRRSLLAGVGTVLPGTAVGCLDRSDGGDGSTETGGDEPSADWFAVAGTAPALAAGGLPPDVHAAAVHVTSQSAARTAFGEAADHPFVAATDFDAATLFWVGTWAPNGCHALRLAALDREGDLLTGRFESRDVAGESEECPAVVLDVARLVRVSHDDDRVTRAELTVTDGWGTSETVESVGPDAYADLVGDHGERDGDADDRDADDSDDEADVDPRSIEVVLANFTDEGEAVDLHVAGDARTFVDGSFGLAGTERKRVETGIEEPGEYRIRVRVDGDRTTDATVDVDDFALRAESNVIVEIREERVRIVVEE